jgi:hypothetical protein
MRLSARRAASMVKSMSSSVCCRPVKPASNWLGARYTPSSSIALRFGGGGEEGGGGVQSHPVRSAAERARRTSGTWAAWGGHVGHKRGARVGRTAQRQAGVARAGASALDARQAGAHRWKRANLAVSAFSEASSKQVMGPSQKKKPNMPLRGGKRAAGRRAGGWKGGSRWAVCHVRLPPQATRGQPAPRPYVSGLCRNARRRRSSKRRRPPRPLPSPGCRRT